MVNMPDLKTRSQVADEQARANPEVQRELERTALANDVAIRVIRYRTEHGLSQTQPRGNSDCTSQLSHGLRPATMSRP